MAFDFGAELKHTSNFMLYDEPAQNAMILCKMGKMF